MKSKPPIFKKSVFALLFAIILALFTLQRGEKAKTAFQRIDGLVTAIDKTNENYPGKDSIKFRYLLLDNYVKPFELFIGKGPGDFKPKFEFIDDLKTNDTITVYFEENNNTRNAPVNNLAYFIDRGQEVIFIKGNSIKYLIYGLIGFCAICILLLILLRYKGKIV